MTDPTLQGFLLATAQEEWEAWYGITRLVFADWLEERGDSRAARVRAEKENTQEIIDHLTANPDVIEMAARLGNMQAQDIEQIALAVHKSPLLQRAADRARASSQHDCRRRVLALFPEVEVVVRRDATDHFSGHSSRPRESHPLQLFRTVEPGSLAGRVGCVIGVPCCMAWEVVEDRCWLVQTIRAPDLIPKGNSPAHSGAP